MKDHGRAHAVGPPLALTEPEAPARLVGWSITLKELALRMRCSKCGRKTAEC